jgi:protein-L-isoaspartate(D-aspartate) O-methyltransferase
MTAILSAAVVFSLCVASPTWGQAPGAAFQEQRLAMVDTQLRRRGLDAPLILGAMKDVPRHLFVPRDVREQAYLDAPVRFAPGQTLSQAYISAQMIDLLKISSDDKVLEVGTGSGYDAAVLSRLVSKVYTIEIDTALARRAQRLLAELGYDNVEVRAGDGYRGWAEAGPFDAILLTTAPNRIPEPLFDQLKVGGRMVVPVGGMVQDLQVITKMEDGRRVRRISPVVLGPMTGEVRDN